MTDSRSSELLERLALPLYFVAALLALSPSLELLISVLPLRVSELQWRFATAGFVSGILLSVLLGIVLALLIAVAQEHMVMVRTIGFACLAGGVVLLLILAMFSLDTLQLNASVRPDAKRAFQMAALKAGLKYCAATLALLWIGVVAVRSARGVSKSRSSPKAARSPLVSAPLATKPESAER